MATRRLNSIYLRGLENSVIKQPKTKLQLSDEEKRELKQYFQNPTETGIWKLTMNWNKKSEFSKLIINSIPESKRIPEMADYVDTKTFIYCLFSNQYFNETNNQEAIKQINSENEHYAQSIKLIPANSLSKLFKKQLHEAYTIFKNEIVYNLFDPAISEEKILRIKEGIYIYSDDKKLDYVFSAYRHQQSSSNKENEYTITLQSLFHRPLESINKFYLQLGTVSDTKLSRIFSPKEETLNPYPIFFEPLIQEIFDKSISNKIERSLNHYHDGEFEYCISTLGIVSEEILTQIYESLSRKPSDDGATLGEIVQSLEMLVPQTKKGMGSPDLSNLNKKIGPLIGNNKSTARDGLLISKDILDYINAYVKYQDKRYSLLKNKVLSLSLFPKQIQRNIGEIIRYRNAVSHRSYVTIGDYESLRSMYCTTAIYIWWENEKRNIDWKESTEKILESVISRSHSNPITGLNVG